MKIKLFVSFILVAILACIAYAEWSSRGEVSASKCARLGGSVLSLQDISTQGRENACPDDRYLGQVSGVMCPCICCKP